MKMRIIVGIIIVFGLISNYFCISCTNEMKKQGTVETALLEEQKRLEKQREEWNQTFMRTKLKADSAKKYCESNGLRTDYCYLVDFKIHSGKNRFFVWDFQKDTIVDAGLCCHGYGNSQNRSTTSRPIFSNVTGSLCSSLGHYKIAYRDACSYGLLFQYRIHGLDKTNNNALSRAVTLHSYKLVPNEEIYPEHIPLGYSQGCLVVSDSVLYRLDTMLKNKAKPLMIWAYYN